MSEFGKPETVELDGTKYTTHPIIDYDGDDFTYFIDVIKEKYSQEGIEVVNIRTYYNDGYNHVIQEYDKPKEFGIEVEHV